MTQRIDRASEMGTERHHLDGVPTCKKCNAINVRGAHFCAECGAVLGVSPVLHRSEEDARARREALDALKRAYKWIAGLTWFYRAGALVYAVVTVFAILSLASSDVPLGGGILVVALTTLLTVLMLMAAIQVLFEPFVWTAVVASIATVETLVHLVGPNPYGLMLFGSAAWAVLFWATLLPTIRFRALMAEHEDMYILHHSSRYTKRTLQGRSAKERHERLIAVMRNAERQAWKVSAAAAALVIVASTMGTYSVVSDARPQELSAAIEDFETAWNDRGLEAAVGSFPSETRERWYTWLEGVAEGHGWADSLPRLEEREISQVLDRTWIDYDLDGIALATCWVMDGKRWHLVEVTVPKPPLEPVLDLFLQAWRRSDTKAIAAMFPPDFVERMHESIEASVDLRGWDPLPEIVEVDTGEAVEGEVPVTLAVATGDVKTKWVFRADGRWGLHALKFPKR